MSNNVWMDFALAGSIGISWMALALAFVCYARLRKQSLLTQKLYQRLDHNLQVTSNGSIGMGRRLIALEKQLQQVEANEAALLASQQPKTTNQPEVVSEPELSGDDELAVPAAVSRGAALVQGLAPDLADAARLLSAGLATDEVARRCGISRAEASLMQLMHAQVKGAAA